MRRTKRTRAARPKRKRNRRRHDRHPRRADDGPWPERAGQLPAREMVNKWAAAQDVDCPPWFTFDEHGNQLYAHETAQAELARAGERGGEVWLWCIHCRRFFQARHLKLDFLGNWQQCPFDDCGVAGFEVCIFTWDANLRDDPRWPSSVDELRYGMRVGDAAPALPC